MPPPVPPPDAGGTDASAGFDVQAFLDGLADELGASEAAAFEAPEAAADIAIAEAETKAPRPGASRAVIGLGLLVAAAAVWRG